MKPTRVNLKRLSITLFALFIGFAAMAAADAGRAASLEKRDVNIAIGGSSAQLYFLPVILADQLGYFKQEGLNAAIFDTGAGAKALQALVGGGADIAAGSFEHPLRLQARGQNIVAFVKYGRFHGNVLGVTRKHAADYKSPADLKGWMIGVSAPGSSSHIFASLLLAKNGMSPDDASFVAVGQGPGGVAAVRTGRQLDAVCLTDPTISELESTGDIVVMIDSRSLKGTIEAYGGETISGVLYTTHDFLTRNPNTAQALTNGVVRALNWIKASSIDEIVAKIPAAYTGGRPGLYKTMMEKNIENYQSDGTFSDAAVTTTVNFLKQTDKELKNATLDPKKAYDNSFAKKANEIIGAGK